ncbi:hypothetical protein FHS30_001088 [Simiduia aestuariiviva]|uniref:Uncharacterized protein n=1 Tax=Simiduia aestuariiviva TaxID=1510459 RepID=A0A839UJ76_9GAMM|nr:hypothetical protein [Simiduia aestuariiviva]
MAKDGHLSGVPPWTSVPPDPKNSNVDLNDKPFAHKKAAQKRGFL